VAIPVTNFAQIFATSFDNVEKTITATVAHATSAVNVTSQVVASVKSQPKATHAKELALLMIKPTSISKEFVSILSELAYKLMPSVVDTVNKCTSFIPTSVSKEFLFILGEIASKRLPANVTTLNWLTSVAKYIIKAIKLYNYLTVHFGLSFNDFKLV